MTTIVGIKANSSIEGIVLGADRQLTSYDDAGEKITRREQTCKLTYGKNWIIGDVGGESNQFAVLLRSKKKLENSIYKAISRYYDNPKSRKPHFPEINYINTIAKRNGAEDDCLHQFALAARYKENFTLWHVDQFGNLYEIKKEWHMTLGTGEYYAIKHLNFIYEKGIIDCKSITIPEAIDIASKCLEEAEQDPTSSGLDLAVLTKKGVQYYGDFIQQTIEKQKAQMIKKIKRNYQ